MGRGEYGTGTRPSPVLALVIAAAVWPLGLRAQEGCQFVEGAGNLRTVDFGGNPITYVSTPNLVCRDGVRMRADSAVAYRASSYVQMIGRVRFEDPERILTARTAEYFTAAGRLQAHDSVELTEKSDDGMIRGEELIYLRAGPERALDQLNMSGGRPKARLYVGPSPDTAEPSPDEPEAGSGGSNAPYDVEADRILLEGDSYFRALGRVSIQRGELQAFGDSVEYDQVGGTLHLSGQARMIPNQGREITAGVIHALLSEGEIHEVMARGDAVLVSENARLTAPLVHVFFADGVMARLVAIPITPRSVAPREPLVAVPPSGTADAARPVATAETLTIVADSLDMLTPAEVLERIHATGTARAESSARDSLNTPETPAVARTDWMEGDTIIAEFEPVTGPAGPPQGEPGAADVQVRRLSAVGSARSLYRMEPNDSARTRGDRRPAIHYVTAASITIDMHDGEIERMEVRGATDGVHVEPAGGAVPDSAATDTAGADTATVSGAAQRGGAADPPQEPPGGGGPDPEAPAPLPARGLAMAR